MATARIVYGYVQTPARRGALFLERLMETAVLCTFLVSCLPEIWSKPLRVGEISLLNILFCACAFGAFALAAKRGVRRPGYLVLAIFAALYMSIVGRFNQDRLPYDEKVFFADLLTFAGLVGGFAWGAVVQPLRLARFLRLAAIATCTVLAGTHALLFIGVLKPVWAGQRVFVWSVFSAIWWLTVNMPFIVATEAPVKGLLSARTTRLIALACLLTVCASSLLSGTRSVLIQVAICAILCLRPLVKNFVHAWGIAILVVALGIGVYFFGDASALNLEFMASRVQGTQVQDEQRYLELQMMLDQLWPDIWTGQGFGVMFTSPVIVNNSPLAVAPHVGVLALLFKGGFLTLMALMALPACLAVSHLVFNRSSWIRNGCWGGALLYVTSASMSGGWGFLQLFLFGLFFSMALHLPKRTVSSSQCSPPTARIF